MIAAVFQIMMGGLFGEAAPKSFSPFVVANLLLLALVLSEITKFTYKLITYRRGV